MKLDSSTVYRGGVTTDYVTTEPTTPHIRYDQREDVLELRLSLRSKGGGTTRVIIKMPPEDQGNIIDMIAKNSKQSTIMLSEGVLSSSRVFHERNQALQYSENEESISDEIGLLEDYISQVYEDLPEGEDEVEKNLLTKISDIKSRLEAFLS